MYTTTNINCRIMIKIIFLLLKVYRTQWQLCATRVLQRREKLYKDHKNTSARNSPTQSYFIQANFIHAAILF